jgi:hypothetical protein
MDWDDKEFCQAQITPEAIVHAAKNANLEGVEQSLIAELTVDHIIVDVSKMHYGRGVANPIYQVKFYSKHEPNGDHRILQYDICTDPSPSVPAGRVGRRLPFDAREIWRAPPEGLHQGREIYGTSANRVPTCAEVPSYAG